MPEPPATDQDQRHAPGGDGSTDDLCCRFAGLRIEGQTTTSAAIVKGVRSELRRGKCWPYRESGAGNRHRLAAMVIRRAAEFRRHDPVDGVDL